MVLASVKDRSRAEGYLSSVPVRTLHVGANAGIGYAGTVNLYRRNWGAAAGRRSAPIAAAGREYGRCRFRRWGSPQAQYGAGDEDAETFTVPAMLGFAAS
jgi:hypothetical protein